MRTSCFLSVLVVAFSFSPLIAAADKDVKQAPAEATAFAAQRGLSRKVDPLGLRRGR